MWSCFPYRCDDLVARCRDASKESRTLSALSDILLNPSLLPQFSIYLLVRVTAHVDSSCSSPSRRLARPASLHMNFRCASALTPISLSSCGFISFNSEPITLCSENCLAYWGIPICFIPPTWLGLTRRDWLHIYVYIYLTWATHEAVMTGLQWSILGPASLLVSHQLSCHEGTTVHLLRFSKKKSDWAFLSSLGSFLRWPSFGIKDHGSSSALPLSKSAPSVRRWRTLSAYTQRSSDRNHSASYTQISTVRTKEKENCGISLPFHYPTGQEEAEAQNQHVSCPAGSQWNH